MRLTNLIKNDESIRRLFGKKELKIIEKQLWGLKLKDSEKTRLSRDIRKKFKAIEKLAEFKNEFGLKKGIYIAEIIKDSKEEILKTKYFSRIKKIYLFGSVTENLIHFDSDVDIAVEFEDIDLKESTEFRLKMLSRLDKKVDIQVFNVLPEKIKKEIREKGRIIYEQNRR